MELSPSMAGRLIVAMGAAAGWLLTTSATQDATPGRDAPSVARPIDAGSFPPARFTETLRDRMHQPVQPERGRNPFIYGARVAPSRGSEPVVTTEPDVMPMPVEPPQPVFRLSGIATTETDAGAVLTAIVIDNGALVLAKAGDRLSNGYSVARVDEMSITLVDAAGVTQTIRLP